jgi:glycogen(starch) synthase
MRILLHTRFYPNLGGIETVAWLLAHEWHRLGEMVTVVSDVACVPDQRRKFPFPVYYRPNPLQWLRLMRSADVFVHMNISLKALWPLLIVRRPFVAVNHAYYYSDLTGYRDWRELLKLRVMKKATNIAVSEAVAQRLPEPCIVIPNPVDLSLFQANGHVARTRDLVFLGRLVSDKGCDLLIQALGRLAERGVRPLLTVIGHGPERSRLERLARSFNLEDQVAFAGAPPSDEVANLLRQHNVMVVPSLWEESFGVVALEGIASGCVIVGSQGGGLPEAIGPCGLTFPNGDANALAEKLQQVLTNKQLAKKLLSHAKDHLAKHHPSTVAQQYLQVIRQAVP